MSMKIVFVLCIWTLAMVALMCPALWEGPRGGVRTIATGLARPDMPITETEGGFRHQRGLALAASDSALWSAVLMASGALCGQAALWVCDRGRTRSIRMLQVMSSGAHWQEVLSRMPATVSETIHDTSSPHGTAFKGLMVIMALLMLASRFTKYELYTLDWDESDIVFNAMRSICPTVGIVMLVFIPSNTDVLQMVDRCRDPNYQITEADRNIFLSSGIQDSLHAVGGVISFVASSLFDFLHLNWALWGAFFSGYVDDSLVRWGDDSIASFMWLTLAIFRYLVLLSIVPCAVRFAYETRFEPTERCRWQNPDFSYLPERMLIAQLAANVMLTGTSILYVDRQAWERTRPSIRQTLLIVTVFELVLISSLTAWTLWFSACIHTYLSDTHMSKRINSLIRKHKEDISDTARQMRTLRELQSKMRRRVASLELKEESGDTGEDDDAEDD